MSEQRTAATDAEEASAYELLCQHLDNLPFAVVEWDKEFRFIRWSHHAESLFGWPASEVIGLHPNDFNFVYPPDRAKVDSVIASLLNGDEQRNISYNRNVTRDNQIVDCEWHNSVQRRSDGTLISVLSLVRDVTETHAIAQRTEALLAQEQALKEQFRVLFESAPGCYLVLTTQDYRIVGASNAYLQSTGMSRTEILDRTLFEAFPDPPDEINPQGTQRLRESLERVERYHQPDIMAVQRYPIPRADGDGFEERFWSSTNIPVFDAKQQLQFILHRVEDVTEFFREGDLDALLDKAGTADATMPSRTEAELYRRSHELKALVERYRSEEERWRRLFSEAAAGIVQTDTEHIVQYANRAFCAMIGRSESEVIGSKMSLFVHPDELSSQQNLQTRLASGSARHEILERRLLHAEGHTVWVRVSVTVQSDVYGGMTGVVAVVEDVSGTRELAERLRESQRLEAIGQLTGGLAHDFNNLLTVVLGNADLLCETLTPLSAERELAATILQSAQRGADLTQRLLAFARGQALDARPTDINLQLSSLLGLLKRTLGQLIDVEFYPAQKLWSVVTDSAQLESALLNICLNSRDAMPNGGRLTLETFNSTLDDDYAEQYLDVQAGDYVCIAISDTGVGIPEADQRRVFEPFFTTKPRGKGTGLGLSMVFGFIKQSNGHVNVYSEVGVGTTVKLYLPRSSEADSRATLAAPAHEVVPRGGECILLVEDDPLVRDYVATQLTTAGYTVLQADSGPAAIAVLHAEERVDLLFTDLMMPGGMTGHELSEAARRLRPALKVLYTSGYAEQAVLQNGRLEIGTHFIGKPYRPAALLKKLREVLNA